MKNQNTALAIVDSAQVIDAKPTFYQRFKTTAVQKVLPIATVGGVLGMSNAANAAEFTLDVASVMSAITVVVAAVTSIGLAALSITITIKAIGYVKKAF